MTPRRVLRLGLVVLGTALGVAACGLYAPDAPRAALEARYAAPPSRFLPVAGL